jgi:hypothetical protein
MESAERLRLRDADDEAKREAISATGLSMVTVSWSGFKELEADVVAAGELTMSRDWFV